MGNQKRKLKRTARVVGVLAKHGFADLAARLGIRHKSLPDSAAQGVEDDTPSNVTVYERIRKVLEALGPTYIKFGQAFSSREDLLPDELVRELKKLQDRVEPEPLDVLQVVAGELDIDPTAHFEHIDPVPIASASISQVYRAVLQDGTPVALKVKRRGIREVVEADLLIMRDLANLLVNYNETFRKINLLHVLDAFEKTILQELSFVHELDNLQRFARNFRAEPILHAVEVYPRLSNDNLLCMGYVTGTKITDREALLAQGISLGHVVDVGLKLYLMQVLEHGFFHADPHPGNMLVLSTGQIAFIDMGSMGTMMPADKEQLEDFIIHFIHQDAKRLIAVIKRMALKAQIGNEKKLEQDIHTLFAMLDGTSLAYLDIKSIFKKFSAILNENEILMPDYLYLLVRGIVLIEGIGRELLPDLNIVERLRPYVNRVVKRRLSPEYLLNKGIDQLRNLSDGLTTLADDLPLVVRQVREGELKTRKEVYISPETKHTFKRAVDRLALAVLGAGSLVGTALAASVKPLFGLLGALLSIAFLIAFVVLSVRRDR